MTNFDITNHAVERFRERIRDVAPERAREEMTHCLLSGKEKKLRRLSKYRFDRSNHTTMIVTGCYIFVFDGKTVVTCLKEFRAKPTSPAR
jgi:hypothetical protein